MKNIKVLVAMLVACGLYAGFLGVEAYRAGQNEAPMIHAPETVAEISVKTPIETLLKSVTAEDPEDGDLSDRVFVESVSDMDETQQRTVRYAVFDSGDRVARAEQKLRYTDYQPPQLTLKKALLVGYYDAEDSPSNYIRASSVLDGDLTDLMVTESKEIGENVYLLTASVRDSAGQESRLSLKGSMLTSQPSFKIELTDYLLYVAPGTQINPRDYIKGIGMMGMDYTDLKDSVEIRTDYDPTTPGMYEFVYYLERPNGDFGMTKLVVIVE